MILPSEVYYTELSAGRPPISSVEEIVIEKQLLTVTEVAEYLRIAPNTVYRWLRAGKLRAIKIGKEWRIEQEVLDHFLGRRTTHLNSASLENLLRRGLNAPEHILVMTDNPSEILSLQAEYLRVGLQAGYPLFLGYWQSPEQLRAGLIEAGLPVRDLETTGRLVLADLHEAYVSLGTAGVLRIWEEQCRLRGGEVLWGTGSHRISDWESRGEGLLSFEAQLHKALLELPVIALCPCLFDSDERSSFKTVVDLLPHHTGALFRSDGSNLLMRATG